jgi:hypothetical protein
MDEARTVHGVRDPMAVRNLPRKDILVITRYERSLEYHNFTTTVINKFNETMPLIPRPYKHIVKHIHCAENDPHRNAFAMYCTVQHDIPKTVFEHMMYGTAIYRFDDVLILDDYRNYMTFLNHCRDRVLVMTDDYRLGVYQEAKS